MQESLLGPSAWSELITVTTFIPALIPRSVKSVLCGCFYRHSQVPVSVTWAEIIESAQSGALSSFDLITASQLVSALNMEVRCL